MSWNKDFPAQTDVVNDTFTQYHDNWDAIEDTFATDHRYMDQEGEGEHLQISFTAPIETPSPQDDKLYTYIKDFAGTESPYTEVVELAHLDQNGDEIQQTSVGRIMPKTVYISWIDATTTATTFPSSGVTVTKTSTGVYDLVFPEIGGSFLIFNYTSCGASGSNLRHFNITEQTSTTATLKTFNQSGTAANNNFRMEIRAAK